MSNINAAERIPIALQTKKGGDMSKKQYPLRIDSTTWDAVQLWAEDEMRSANGQIEWILRDSLKRNGRLPKRKKVKN